MTEVYRTLLPCWFHSKHSMLLNDLSLPSDLKKRKAWERNFPLPPIGCKRKVQRTATKPGEVAERKGCFRSLQCAFTFTLPHPFFQTTLLMPTVGVGAGEDRKVEEKYSSCVVECQTPGPSWPVGFISYMSFFAFTENDRGLQLGISRTPEERSQSNCYLGSQGLNTAVFPCILRSLDSMSSWWLQCPPND